MCNLRTVYPFGLNDRCKGTDWTNKTENQNTSKTCFQSLNHIIPWKKRGKRRGKNQNIDLVWNKIVNSCTCQYKCMELIRYCRVQINSLNIESNKNLATHVTNLLYSNNADVPYSYLETIIDMIDYKLNLAKPKNNQKTSKRKPDVLFPINFHDKHIQDIHLERIFRDKDVKKCVPQNAIHKRPSLLYSYLPTIRNKVLNYKTEIQNLNVDEFLSRWDENECNCVNSKFKDDHYGHIITGNLEIVENLDLRSILKEGPNFRITPRKTDFNQLLTKLKNDVNSGVEKWSILESIPTQAFVPWNALVQKK